MKTKEIVILAIERVNSQLKLKDKIKYEKKFQIIGPKSKLDSLLIVNFFLEIENILKQEFKKNINLLNDNLFEKYSNKKYFILNLEKDLEKKIKKIKK